MLTTASLRQVSLVSQFVQIQFSDVTTNDRPADSIIVQHRYAAYATPAMPQPYSPHRYATQTDNKTHHDCSHKRLSYKLIVYWDPSLNAHVILFSTFALQSWTDLLSKIVGAANEN